MDHESENVSHETISKSESSDEEINSFKKGKNKNKKSRKRMEVNMEEA